MLRRGSLIVVVALAVVGACILASCTRSATGGNSQLVSINIIDRNGLSQTISTKERLRHYEGIDFLKPTAYQKVMRVFARASQGNTGAIITSYHPNGQVKQYLEVVDSRANGLYREWFSNGTLKLEAKVIGGTADLDAYAQESWLFDGLSRAWSERGELAAEILYSRGELHGISSYYHGDGQIAKTIPYHRGQRNGAEETLDIHGKPLEIIYYLSGNRHGPAIGYWPNGDKLYEELYEEDRLLNGTYYDSDGEIIVIVERGSGVRATYSEGRLHELQNFRHGIPDGKIRVFDQHGTLCRTYHVKEGMRHGEELFYFPTNPCDRDSNRSELPAPRVSISWYENRVQGLCKSWYENGNIESQKEMSDNAKHGMSTVWYGNGSLMMIEEYDHDKLLSGQYLKKDEDKPVSRVTSGKGLATLFDDDGNFLNKIAYSEGAPCR